MASVLISSIYNEEYLLPQWLEHHTKLFDHGVIVDSFCTDQSMDMVRELAPDWEIIKTRLDYYHEPGHTREMEAIEMRFPGDWKMVVNTTEFLMVKNLNVHIQKLEEEGVKATRTNGVVMVDRHPNVDTYNLLRDKYYGYFESDLTEDNLDCMGNKNRVRSRLLHCHEHGRYTSGRHTNEWTNNIDYSLFLCWFYWCPWNEQMRDRIRNYINNITPEQIEQTRDFNEAWKERYIVTDQIMEERYRHELGMSRCLIHDRGYLEAYRETV